MRCNSCGVNLSGQNHKRARRFKNQILCDLHFADVALMECSDFMQQLRSFKPQSLGCAVARRKSSTTLIFPLPPQACSGNDHKSFVQLLCCAFLFPMPFRYSKSMDWPFIMRPCRVRREKSVAFTPVIGQIMRFSVGCKKYHRLAH